MKQKLSLPQFFVLVILLALITAPFALGQVPQGFNYQAIVRDDGTNQPIVSQPVLIRITIEDGIGTDLYQEIHSLSTDEFGIVSIIIGQGTPWGTSDFNEIDWNDEPLQLKTEVQYPVGGSYTVMGTAPLMSVPYAMVADSLGGPLKNLKVKGTATTPDTEALFEVKNTSGQTVFAVYNEGVRIYVNDIDAKGAKGGFAIGGFGTTNKTIPHEYLFISGDSVRFYIDNGDADKGPKGGFAIGGFGAVKGLNQQYLTVSNDSVRIYIDNADIDKGPKGGFAIGGYGTAKGKPQDLLTVSNEKVRVYLDEAGNDKGVKGGFAIGGFGVSKGGSTFMNVTPDSTRIFTGDSEKGFGVGSIATGISGSYLRLTPENYFIGHEGGKKLIDGVFNSTLGYQSGKNITTGGSNAFMGYQSGFNNNIGTGNLFLGYQSGFSTQGGNYNSFVGYKSGYSNAGGLNNTFVGSFGGYSNSSGSYNTFVGDSAGYSNSTGDENTFLGTKAGLKNLDGANNLFIGNKAGYNNTGGDSSIFIGNRSGYKNTTGNTNVFLGNRAGFTNTKGFSNVFIGYQAGFLNDDGDYNTIMGYQAGYSNDSSYNSFIGYKSGYSNQTGKFNTFIGYKAGYLNTAGDYNSYIGYNAGAQNSGIHNVYIGPTAGSIGLTGSYNVFVGMGTGSLATGSSNSFVGIGAGYHSKGSDNSFFGSQAGIENNNGSQNVFIGHRAGSENVDASDNVFIGTFAGYSNKDGIKNVYIGTNAGYSNVVGSKNIFIGDHAGEGAYVTEKLFIDNSNTATPLIYGDFNAEYITINGAFNTTGSASINNTWVSAQSMEINASGSGDRDAFIDFHADNTNADFGFRIHRWPGVNGQANIYQVGTGAFGIITMNSAPLNFYTNNTHRMVITATGNVGIGTTAPLYKLAVIGTTYCTDGVWTASDIRYKKNISGIDNLLSYVMNLTPVSYDLKTDEFPDMGFDSSRQIGLIAQDVEKVFPQLVRTDNEGYKSIAYDKVSVMLVEAVKEQQQQIESQKSEIEALQSRLEKIEALLSEYK